MRDLSDWAATRPLGDKPWLILGKGPTFDRLGEFDTSPFNLMSLNHVVAKVDVDVAHMVDLEVVEACGQRLLDGCRFLVVPRRMHRGSWPIGQTTDEILGEWPVLAELDRQGRLVAYNLETSPPASPGPVFTVKYFSVEPALQVAVALGARTVRTLGVDGGRSYSSGFNSATRLENGRNSFDGQFAELATIAAEHGIDFASLVPPLNVFIGLDESEVVAARVLEYTIKANTSYPVAVHHLFGQHLPRPEKAQNKGGTGFSFARFAIPGLTGYRGRAVYLDSDMQVLGDIAELADIPFDGATVLCTSQSQAPSFGPTSAFQPGRQLSVMVLDCERLDWDAKAIVRGLDAGRYSYAELMRELTIVPPSDIADTLPEGWNHLERYDPETTRLIHYTNVPTQPWKNDENPLCGLWMSAYRDAVAGGAVPTAEVEILVARGEVKQSLTAALANAPLRRSPLTQASADLEAGIERLVEAERALAMTARRVGALESTRLFRLVHRANPVANQLREVMRKAKRRSAGARSVTALRKPEE